MLLGTIEEPRSEQLTWEAMNDQRPTGERPHITHNSEWWLQFMDLDTGFGHHLLGLPDQANLISGLLYGIVVALGALYTILAIQSNAPNVSKVARYFMTFAHFQILMYVFVQLVKLPKLCRVIQRQYLTHLQM